MGHGPCIADGRKSEGANSKFAVVNVPAITLCARITFGGRDQRPSHCHVEDTNLAGDIAVMSFGGRDWHTPGEAGSIHNP